MNFRRIISLLLVLALSIGFLPAPAFAADKPDAPVMTASNILSSGDIRLTWDAVEGADLYRIYRSATQSGGYTRIKSTSSTAYTDSSAEVGETFYYLVKAVSESGTTSASSNKVSATARLPRTTVTLSNVTASGKIKVSWTAVDGAEGYEVYRATSKTGTYKLIKTTTATTMTNASTTAGKMYYYQVKALAADPAADSALSSAKARTCKLAQPVAKVTAVTATGKNKISWGAIEDAVSYGLYRSTDKSNWTKICSTTETSHIDDEAVAGTKYYYRLRAISSNSSANSAYSSGKSRTADLAQPVLTLTNEASGRVTLHWDAVEDALEYKVYRAESEDGTYTRIKVTEETSYTDTTAEAGKTYYYKIQAVAANTDGNSAYSQILSGVFTYPEGLTLSIALNGEGKPYLTWNEVAGATGYRVYRSYREKAGFKLLSTRTVTYYTNPSAPEGVALYYQLRAIDADGKVIETSETVPVLLELSEEEMPLTRYVLATSIKIYPAPDTASGATVLRYMDELQLGQAVITSTDSAWYRVFRNGELYYLWMETGDNKLTEEQSSFSYTGNNEVQQAVLDLAMEIHNEWNTVYATGQSNGIPNSDGTYGFNAPGLVKYIFNTVMQEVPFYSLSQVLETLYATTELYNAGYPGELSVADVAMEDLQPGDVLFFGTTAPSYCGIYLGNGEFLYSTSSWEDGVCIMPLNSFLKNLMAIRRYLPEAITPANTTEYIVSSYKTYKLYSEKNSSSTVLKTLALYDAVTVLYTDSGSWAYVRTEDGTEGYFLVKYFGEYEYLDYVTLTASLNGEGKPYLTWNKVKDAVNYEVYRSMTADSGYELLSTSANTYYTNASAPEGMTLYYQVKALAADGTEIDISDTVSVNVPLSVVETLQTRYVSVPSVKLYALPDVSSEAITLRYLDEVQLGAAAITGDTSSWYRVFVNGALSYLRIEPGEEKLSETRGGSGYTGNTDYQQQVIDLAMEICDDWNTVYATGQSEGVANPDGSYGFNSPGFVKYVLNTVMQKAVPTYRLSVSIDTLFAAESIYNAGYDGAFTASDVERADLQPGDVLFFGASEPTYCGIYLGNDEFVYATSSWEDSVCVMPLSGSFADNLMAIRRYLPETVTAADKTEYIVGPYYTYNLYSEMASDSAIVKNLTQYDQVTLLFTNSDNWGYIRTNDGAEGFFLIEHLGEYEYLEYLSVSATLNEEGKPYLNWNKVKDAATYEVYRSLRQDSGYEILTTTPNTYYSNLSAPDGLTLYYKLRALDANGNEIDLSDPVSVTTALVGEETLQTKYVYVPVVNLYNLPDTGSEPLSLRYMEEIRLGSQSIVREDGTWYRAFYEGKLYYLWSADINESLTDIKSSFTYTGNTPYQQQVLDLALEISQQWNTIYAHEQSNGIANPDGTYGFDCSGLVAYIFNRVMQPIVPTYRLYSALETQYATTGIYNAGYPGAFSATDVAPDDLQPGDILFFTSLADGTSSTEIGHCGIYMGNNEFIHSTSSWSDAVCIMRLAGSYLENYVGARRYLPETVTPANTIKSIVGPYYTYNLYSEKISDSAVVTTLAQYDPLTVLFTDNETWAYVRTEDGHEGFFLLEHLGDYDYLDYVTLSAQLNEEGKPYLSWNKVQGAVNYEIYRSLQEAAGYSLISSTENTYYTNTSVPEGMTLYYQVKALDTSGNEIDTSDTVSVTTELSGAETLLTRYVSVPSVKLYALPDTASDSITLRYMDEVKLGSVVTSSWYRAFYQDTLYYLWLDSGDEKLTDVKSTFSYSGNTQLQQEVLDLAAEIANDWNTIYATGQSDGIANSDGTYGFNSPGLVKYVFNSVMQPKVPFYALSQVLDTLYATGDMYNAGYPGEFAVCDVEETDLQPGDVLFFGTSAPTYCGIYLGNGEFVYCSSSWEDGVCIMPLSGFRDALIKIRRYLPEAVTAANTTEYIVGPYKAYKVYAEKSSSSAVLATPAQYDALMVLFTDSDSWAYVRTEDGILGYFLTEYFGEYEYLDYVTLSAELNEDGKPYLTWNKVKDATTYEIYRSLEETTGYSLLSTTENTYYTNATVPEGMTLYYQVKALDASGNEIDTSDTVSVTTELSGAEALLTRYVSVPSVKLYALPDTSSDFITLRYMDEVKLGSVVTSSWYRAFRGDDLYYLWLDTGDEKLTDVKSSFSYSGNTQLQQEVLDLAAEIANEWNTTYATGQSNGVANADGTYGFNSPGLVKYVFNSVMQPKVPFYALSQVLDTLYATGDMYNAGYPGEFAVSDVEETDLQPGDVLFFGTSDPTYCGLYLGNGEFVYSSASWEDGVCIMPLSDFRDSLISIRRYLPEAVTPANTTETVTGSYKNYKVYEQKDSSSTVLTTVPLGDTLTVLFTDSGSWAYVRTADGTEGYFLVKYFA